MSDKEWWPILLIPILLGVFGFTCRDNSMANGRHSIEMDVRYGISLFCIGCLIVVIVWAAKKASEYDQ